MKRYLVLLIISIFLIPLSGTLPTQKIPVWYPQFVTLFSLLFIGCSLKIWDFSKWLSLFTLSCLFNAVIVLQFQPRAIFLMIQIYLCCLASQVISKFNQKHTRIILWSFVGLIVLQFILIILQYFNMCPFFQQTRFLVSDNIVGLCGSRNQLALFFAVTSPILFGLVPILSPIAIIAICLSSTATALISLVVGNAYFAWRSKQRYLFITLLIVGAIFYSSKIEGISSGEVKNRSLVAKNTISQVLNEKAELRVKNVTQIITANRFFGYGLGSFERFSQYSQKYLYEQKGSDGNMLMFTHFYRHAHNDLIEILFDLGIIGFICALMAVLSFFFGYVRSKKTQLLNILFACVFCQLIMSVGIFTVYTATSGVLLIIFYGLYVGELRRIKYG